MSSISYKRHRHGSPYDRGSSDSYYRRPFNPHYFKGDAYNSPRVDLADMTAEEIAEYTTGFRNNEKSGIFKEW